LSGGAATETSPPGTQGNRTSDPDGRTDVAKFYSEAEKALPTFSKWPLSRFINFLEIIWLITVSKEKNDRRCAMA
jgi:hypothetical protein